MLFQPLDKESEEYERLTEYVANTHAATHNQYGLHVVEVSPLSVLFVLLLGRNCHWSHEWMVSEHASKGTVLNSHFQCVICCFMFSCSLQCYYLSLLISSLIVTDLYSHIMVLLYKIYSYDVYYNVAI